MTKAADLLVETIIDCGIRVVFGLPGDGINGIMESIRNRQDRLRFIQVRHEESAAFMATAYAKWTGRLACCLATSGPGAVHLLNGLYDAKCDRVPVLAITGLPYHDLVDTATQQDVATDRLFADAAAYTTRIASAAQIRNAMYLGCRTAYARRGAAHIAIPVDVQEQELEDATPSSRNVEAHAAFSRDKGECRPPRQALDEAARLLNDGQRVAILAGQGARHARAPLRHVAELLAAPIVKALLGKTVVPDDDPLTTGGIGLFGTRPSQEAFDTCDTLLIVGSTFPYIEYYPKPGQARAVQIDIDPSRIGLRHPADVGLVGDAALTLQALSPLLRTKLNRSFLETAQADMAAWRRMRSKAVRQGGDLLKAQEFATALSARLHPNAVIACDSGHNTGICARYIDLQEGQDFAVSGSMASMACGIPYAIAAALAYPERQVVAVVGDGGLSMLMGELATCARYKLPVKIFVIKNNILGQIKWEQMLFLGNPEYECDLQPIDFAAVARACGVAGTSLSQPALCDTVITDALQQPGPALVEVVVDPNEPLLPPKRNDKFVANLEAAIGKGTPGRHEIERALAEEPARTMLGR